MTKMLGFKLREYVYNVYSAMRRVAGQWVWHRRPSIAYEMNLPYNGVQAERYYCGRDLHREDGPAVIWDTGQKEWYQHGKRHREDGPAVELHFRNEWYLNGYRHRLDGPAVDDGLDKDDARDWYVDGVCIFYLCITQVFCYRRFWTGYWKRCTESFTFFIFNHTTDCLSFYVVISTEMPYYYSAKSSGKLKTYKDAVAYIDRLVYADNRKWSA